MTGPRSPQERRPRNAGRWPSPAIRPGDVVTADEGDHQGGPGRLVLEVVEVGRRERRDDGLWLHLRGVEVSRPDGVRRRQRRVCVRLAAVTVRPGRHRTARPSAVRADPGTPGPDPRAGRRAPERHVPVRPGWGCAGCGRDWPCADLRRRLLVEFAGDRIGLSLLLTSYLLDALAERTDLSPADLRVRFLGWLPRRR